VHASSPDNRQIVRTRSHFSQMEPPVSQAQLPAGHSLSFPLAIVCQLARLVAAAWIIWALVRVTMIWSDKDAILRLYGRIAGPTLEPMSGLQHASSYLIILIVWAAAAAIVVKLWQLFGHYIAGRIFDRRAVSTFRVLAWTAVAAFTADLVMRPVLFAIVSNGGFAFWSDPNDLLHAAVVLFLVILAEVFSAGAAIADEHSQIV
jgi:hypothetical protein